MYSVQTNYGNKSDYNSGVNFQDRYNQMIKNSVSRSCGDYSSEGFSLEEYTRKAPKKLNSMYNFFN